MSASLFDRHGQPQHVLVTGARSPAAPDLVRWLNDLGHHVTVSDCIHFPVARACREAAQFHRYPSPRLQSAAFAAWMQAHARDFDWIWPCCEEVFWLAQIPQIPLFAPPFTLLERTHRKDRLPELINGLSPRFAVPPSEPFAGGAVPAGLIAKPVFGRFGHRTHRGPTTLPPAAPHDPWITQPHLAGRERCLHAIAQNGQLIACVVYADPSRTGTSPCYTFQREPAPELHAFAAAFCATHQWTGQIGFDAITDAANHHWIVDANPRLTSGMHLIHRPLAPAVALPVLPRLRRRTLPAENALTAPGDAGPAWLAPLTTFELILRHGFPLERAATADLQWP